MNDKAQVAEDLRSAASMIEKRGWIQGAPVTRDGVCALGAINLATDYSERCQEAVWTLAEYLELNNPVVPAAMKIPAWNDAPGRTKQDVVQAMEKAAAWAEEQA